MRVGNINVKEEGKTRRKKGVTLRRDLSLGCCQIRETHAREVAYGYVRLWTPALISILRTKSLLPDKNAWSIHFQSRTPLLSREDKPSGRRVY